MKIGRRSIGDDQYEGILLELTKIGGAILPSQVGDLFGHQAEILIRAAEIGLLHEDLRTLFRFKDSPKIFVERFKMLTELRSITLSTEDEILLHRFERGLTSDNEKIDVKLQKSLQNTSYYRQTHYR